MSGGGAPGGTGPGTAVPAGGDDAAAQRRAHLEAALRARLAAPGRLAPHQERLAVLQLVDPASTAYSEAAVMRLTGPLDEPALLTALRSLPERHEWLRSTVRADAEGVVQVLDDGLVPDVRSTALEPGATAAADRRHLPPVAGAWVTALAEEPLDLLAGPLWRAGLARLDVDDHVLVLVVHHVACDATALSVLLEELGERYRGAVAGTAPDLPSATSPRDAARAMRRAAEGPAALAAAAANAEELLRSAEEPSVALGASPVPGAPSSGGRVGVRVRRVPRSSADRLDRFADRHGLTPFAVTTAVVAAALARSASDGLPGPSSPVLAAPLDLRWQHPGSEDVVAFCVETLCLVVDRVLDRSLLEAAGAVRSAVALALGAPPPLHLVAEELRRRGTEPAAVLPRVYVGLLQDDDDRATLGPGGPLVTHVDLPVGPPKVEQSWTVRVRGDQVDLRLEHDPTALGPEAADALLEQVLRLLDAALADPRAPLGDLDVLPEADRRLLEGWEGTVADPPAEDLLSHVLRGVAGPHAVLVTDAGAVSGDVVLSRVDALAAALVGAGVRPGDRVAVASRRVPGLVVHLLAVLRAGATYVPVDVGHPAARQALVAARARVAAVVGEAAWAGPVAAATSALQVVTDDDGLPLVPAARPAAWPARTPQDLAYVMPTSGSTGAPKGVLVPDGAVVARSLSYREVLASEDVRLLLQSTIAFDASVYLFWALATGGCLVLPHDEEVADPFALVRHVDDHAVTDAFVVPGVLEALLGAAAPGSLVTLRRVLAGGDVLPPAVAALHLERLPGTRLLDVYGPTEAVVTATSAEITTTEVDSGSSMPIGRPHPGTAVRVVDAAGRRLPPGAVGELRIGGPCVAAGYEGVPSGDPTAGAFAVEVGTDGRAVRWYATGDLVRWRPDGQLEYRGRRDRQVKLRGQRVELGEVEAALARVPGVREAAVEVVGRSRPRLVALVAPEAPGVRSAAADLLPPAWLPDVVLGAASLPRLPSGKLDRTALRRRAQEGARAPRPPLEDSPAEALEAPSDPVEEAVLGVLRSVLDEPRLGPDDDFFAVGGTSLLAARLVGRLRSEVDLLVPLHELVRRPTARGIALAGTRRSTGRSTPSPDQDGSTRARLLAVRAVAARAPVVLVARDGAEGLVLQHALARALPDSPIWTLLRGMPPMGAQTPDLVADGRAAAALVAAQLPEGPVHVLGHSASGVVALELARALGDRRGAVVLLDSIPPSSWSSPLERLDDVARGAVRHARVRRAERGRGPDAGPADESSARTRRDQQDARAVLSVRLATADFPVVLLTSAEAREARGDDLGWGHRLRRLEAVPLTGDHHAMVVAPQAAETADVVAGVVTRW